MLSNPYIQEESKTLTKWKHPEIEDVHDHIEGAVKQGHLSSLTINNATSE